MLLTLKEIKWQCRLENDFTDEDGYLELLGRASEVKASRYLNRNIYTSDEDIPETDTDGIVVTDNIRLALLLIVCHWYENRSSVSEVEKSEIPQGFIFLLEDERNPTSG